MNLTLKKVVPAGHVYVKENILSRGNLTGISEKTDLWAKGLNIPERAELILFAGCGYQQMKYVEGMITALKSANKMGFGVGKVVGISKAFSKVGINLTNITAKVTASKEDLYTPVLISAVNILRKLGVDFGYLHEDEPCCGSPMYYSGFEEEFSALAKRNCEHFRQLGVKKIIGIVPACTSALRDYYPRYVEDFDFEVQHILQLVSSGMEQKMLQAGVEVPLKVTYHDPCQLSRYLKIIKEPRSILRHIKGVELIEPYDEETRRWSTCCGGGNMETSHPDLSERMGNRRLEILKKTGASVIVTNCPACEMQLNNSIKRSGDHLKVVDILRFLDSTIK